MLLFYLLAALLCTTKTTTTTTLPISIIVDGAAMLPAEFVTPRPRLLSSILLDVKKEERRETCLRSLLTG